MATQTKIRLEKNWRDSSNEVDDLQYALNELTSTLTEDQVKLLERVIRNQYRVGVNDNEDDNMGMDL